MENCPTTAHLPRDTRSTTEVSVILIKNVPIIMSLKCWDSLPVPDEIEVASITVDGTTILEIQATIALQELKTIKRLYWTGKKMYAVGFAALIDWVVVDNVTP